MLILGALLLSAALLLAFRRPTAGTVSAYAGVWAMRASGYCPLSTQIMLFWAVAVLVVVSIEMARRPPVTVPLRARAFIAGGALAGAAAGMAMWQTGAIVGAAAGVLLGVVAYSGISRFRDYRALWQWSLAAGFPAIITMTLVALCMEMLMLKS